MGEHREDWMFDELTRRQLIRGGAAGGALAAAYALSPGSVLRQALAAKPPRCASLRDIEHIVILMQENRSFDHYFGTYPGVDGFDDRRHGGKAFTQRGYDAPGFDGKLLPFHFDSFDGLGECTHDITHSWGPQHRSWDGGDMDRFYLEHKAVDGPAIGASTMGYYRRADLDFDYALADAFTICDAFFCSALGPTDPNRLYAMSATLDPAGSNGGPLLETLVATRGQKAGAFTWTTMPEQLQARGIDWKVYTSPSGGVFQNVLPYFHNFQTNAELQARGTTPTYPNDFDADLAAGHLPQVSWVLPELLQTEHPPYGPPTRGEFATAQLLSKLSADSERWSKTALIVTYDENGGFFDHVPPPTPRSETDGEFLTVANLPTAAEGIRGPIGLGFRVPTLIVSPLSRGGFVSSEVFDHTSVLRLLEKRFGAEVPNLSHWRRAVTGDLTAAFNFAGPDGSVPSLPSPSLSDPRVTSGSCATFGEQAYPVPPNQMPTQEPGKRRHPSGVCHRDDHNDEPDHRPRPHRRAKHRRRSPTRS
jgi:phospholipase C